MGNQGWMTHTIALVAVVAGIINIVSKFLEGEPVSLTDFELVVYGGGLSALRNGVAKNGGPQPRSFPPGR